MNNRDNFNLLSQKIRELYAIVSVLEEQFSGRHFTPDGHLVGSIGEVLAAYYYGLELLPASAETHDAISGDGKLVQIKATQAKSISLYSNPDYLIVLKILKNGESIELYNGPGNLVWNMAGKIQKNGQRSISVAKLIRIMNDVPTIDRLKRMI